MLGVKCDNRDSVHGPMKVVLTPNIGLEEFRSLHTLELVRPIPAHAGFVSFAVNQQADEDDI
jgi:hypothetical protein